MKCEKLTFLRTFKSSDVLRSVGQYSYRRFGASYIGQLVPEGLRHYWTFRNVAIYQQTRCEIPDPMCLQGKYWRSKTSANISTGRSNNRIGVNKITGENAETHLNAKFRRTPSREHWLRDYVDSKNTKITNIFNVQKTRRMLTTKHMAR
jgi:hypothetical protein